MSPPSRPLLAGAGPCLGASGPSLACYRHLPPPSSGSHYVKPGCSSGASSREFIFWQEGMGSWVLGEKAPFPQAERLGLEFRFRQGVLLCPSRSGSSCAGRKEARRRTWVWSPACCPPPAPVCYDGGRGEPTECRTLPRTWRRDAGTEGALFLSLPSLRLWLNRGVFSGHITWIPGCLLGSRW